MDEMIEETLEDAHKRMDGAVGVYRHGIAGVRTNRAAPAIVENITVDYHCRPMPMNQLAQISAGDARLLVIQPWDRSAVDLIVKAIQSSDLGMMPNVDGEIIRINIPPMTEERRKEVVRMIRRRSEEAKVAVRNVRRDAQDTIRTLEKEGEVGQDESKRAQTRLQGLTDDAVAAVDEATQAKEADVMQV